MIVTLFVAASAVLVGGCALGAVIYGVSAHLEADDMDGAPPYNWARTRTWVEPSAHRQVGWPDRAPAAVAAGARQEPAKRRESLIRTPAL